MLASILGARHETCKYWKPTFSFTFKNLKLTLFNKFVKFANSCENIVCSFDVNNNVTQHDSEYVNLIE